MNKQPLSPLQRAILEIASQKQFVNYTDVLTTYYGFTPCYSRSGSLASPHCPREQGKLQTARVAICKSFNRLVARGLVYRVHNWRQAWCSITLAGDLV